MSNYYRPHHPKPDGNQKEIFASLSLMVGNWQAVEDKKGNFINAYSFTIMGVPGVIIDRSKAGGLNLDTSVYIRGKCRDVEIKQKGHEKDLTPGEKMYFELMPENGHVVVSAEQYYDILYELAINE